ncbi:MAG: hypothetical protein JSR58_03340 [Verrucomicrobia bacterium]|nr:hypothetical protein [Verrucomicrobiota bacterium]
MAAGIVIGSGLLVAGATAGLVNHYWTGKTGELNTAEGLKKVFTYGARYATNIAAASLAAGAMAEAINPDDLPQLDRLELIAGLATFFFTCVFLHWATQTGNSKDTAGDKEATWMHQIATSTISLLAGTITMFALDYILDRE